MIKIEILNKDMIFGNFRSSDYGLIIGSFNYSGKSEDNIGMNTTTIEEFIGHNPIPIYLGEKYTDKLKLQITLIKNPKTFSYRNLFFNEKDCRWILRSLTGYKGYQWLKLIVQNPDEDLWYKAKITSISYECIGGHITGVILSLECDSHFAWSNIYNVNIKVTAGKNFYIFNDTDDLNNYIYPKISILSSSTGNLSISNINDRNWTSEIKNIRNKEEITIDSEHQIISSNLPSHELLLNDFNLGWLRLLPGKNTYVSNMNITISMKYRVPRKVGVIT